MNQVLHESFHQRHRQKELEREGSPPFDPAWCEQWHSSPPAQGLRRADLTPKSEPRPLCESKRLEDINVTWGLITSFEWQNQLKHKSIPFDLSNSISKRFRLETTKHQHSKILSVWNCWQQATPVVQAAIKWGDTVWVYLKTILVSS